MYESDSNQLLNFKLVVTKTEKHIASTILQGRFESKYFRKCRFNDFLMTEKQIKEKMLNYRRNYKPKDYPSFCPTVECVLFSRMYTVKCTVEGGPG